MHSQASPQNVQGQHTGVDYLTLPHQVKSVSYAFPDRKIFSYSEPGNQALWPQPPLLYYEDNYQVAQVKWLD